MSVALSHRHTVTDGKERERESEAGVRGREEIRGDGGSRLVSTVDCRQQEQRRRQQQRRAALDAVPGSIHSLSHTHSLTHSHTRSQSAHSLTRTHLLQRSEGERESEGRAEARVTDARDKMAGRCGWGSVPNLTLGCARLPAAASQTEGVREREREDRWTTGESKGAGECVSGRPSQLQVRLFRSLHFIHSRNSSDRSSSSSR